MKSVDLPVWGAEFTEGNGVLSTQGMILLQKMAEALIEAQAEVAALKLRVTALEP